MSNSHDFLTRKVLDALPDWQQALWASSREKIIAEYCWYPDWYYSPDRHQQAAARPYVIMVDGVPFHYLPANPVETNNWTVEADGALRRLPNAPNRHWQFVAKGFHDSLLPLLDHFRAGRTEEAARFAGALLHVVEDAGSGVHVLEGIDGTDAMLMDRLMAPPSGRISDRPGTILRQDDAVQFEWGLFQPTLLGTTVGEIIFHLFRRYAAMVRLNRLELVPMIQQHWDGDLAASRARIGTMNRRVCEVAADLLYTLTCVAADRFSSSDLEPLEQVALEDLEPIHRPYILPGYEASPLVNGHNLDSEGELVALCLDLPEGRHEFAAGLGTGCHVEYLLAYDLPSRVFERFRGCVGLHAELGAEGAFAVEMRLAGQTLYEDTFDRKHPAAAFDLPVAAGGMLELYVRDCTGAWDSPHNHVVWGGVELVRAEGR